MHWEFWTKKVDEEDLIENGEFVSLRVFSFQLRVFFFFFFLLFTASVLCSLVVINKKCALTEPRVKWFQHNHCNYSAVMFSVLSTVFFCSPTV